MIIQSNMCFAQYRHILINHLGYIAFMRNRLSQDTNIIPVIPHGNDVGPNIIKFLEPDFLIELHELFSRVSGLAGNYLKYRTVI